MARFEICRTSLRDMKRSGISSPVKICVTKEEDASLAVHSLPQIDLPHTQVIDSKMVDYLRALEAQPSFIVYFS